MGPKSVGTSSNPVTDTSPMGLALAISRDLFRTEKGRTAIWESKGDFWVWEDNMWKVKAGVEVEDVVWKWLSAAHVKEITKAGELVKKVPYNKSLVEATKRCLESLVRMPPGKMPRWTEGGEGCDPEWCVGFEDVVVDVKATAALRKQGDATTWVTIPRDERWFDCSLVPVKWDPTAVCPRWEQCLNEWGAGDPKWATVLKRESGLRRIAYREYAKWFMHYGRSRAGKGTIERIERHMTGHYAYMSVRMSALSKNFGLHKLVRARAMVINEVVELDRALVEETSGLLKNILGRDPIDIDRKYMDQMENVVSGAVVVMSGNEMPNLSNKGSGLSGKMIPLNFDVSFEGKTDEGLEGVLLNELPGIARWSVEGAVELLTSSAEDRWPLTDGAKHALEKFQLLNNPADAFLHWGFSKAQGRFVASDLVFNRYEQFCLEMKWRPIARTQFNNWLESQNSWGVFKARDGSGGRNGFRNIGLKAEPGWEEGHM